MASTLAIESLGRIARSTACGSAVEPTSADDDCADEAATFPAAVAEALEALSALKQSIDKPRGKCTTTEKLGG